MAFHQVRETSSSGLPYKIVDRLGKTPIGVVVSSLDELMKKGAEKFGIPTEDMHVMLEKDGSTIVDEECFSRMVPNTRFVIARHGEPWLSPSQYEYWDRTAGSNDRDREQSKLIVELLQRLRNDYGQITIMGGKDLALLAKMEPEQLDVQYDSTTVHREFMTCVKETSVRYLNDQKDAQEAVELLKIYRTVTSSMIGRGLTKSSGVKYVDKNVQ